MVKASGDSAVAVAGLRKAFGATVAVDDVSFAIERGTVHALLGENGAGKSTIVKILTGIYQPDEGTITLDGAAVSFPTAHAASAAGVTAIHQ